uniref:Uncharacterized protein n=1 Tax=Ananas comosus var. bracteatus TaxID=296719 RepID=A0A6V7Q212_ANACO|nr:unnamed protein product [Ananas comosus var. bracteatus]
MGSSSSPLGLLMRPPNPTVSLSSSPPPPPPPPPWGPRAPPKTLAFRALPHSPSNGRWVGAKIAPWGQTALNSKHWWLRGCMRRGRAEIIARNQSAGGAFMFGPDEDNGTQVPTQAQSVVEGSGAVLVSEYKPIPDIDYLQELLAIQQQGPRAIGFFGREIWDSCISNLLRF